MFEYKKIQGRLNEQQCTLINAKKETKPKTNQNKIKSNRMSMRLLGGIWSVVRLSPLKPKKREIEIYQGIPFLSCFVGIKVLGYTL